MMSEIMDSIKSNISNRIRNPFLGTLTLVYVYKNWEFFYALATLPTSEPIDKRIASIKPLFAKAISWDSILLVLGVTVGVFLASYVLLSLSRLVVLFFSKIVNPRIEKITDDKSIVPRNLYDIAINKISSLEEKLEAEHKLVTSLREERDQLQDKVLSGPAVNSQEEEESESVKTTGNRSQIETSNPLFDKLYNYIQINNMGTLFENIINAVRTNKGIAPSRLVDELINYSVIARNPRSAMDSRYIFTELGNQFVQYYVLRK